MGKTNNYSNIFKKGIYSSLIIPSFNNIVASECKSLEDISDFFMKFEKENATYSNLKDHLKPFEQEWFPSCDIDIKNKYLNGTDIFEKLILEAKIVDSFFEIDNEDWNKNENKYKKNCKILSIYETLIDELTNIYTKNNENDLLTKITEFKNNIDSVIKEIIGENNNLEYIFIIKNLEMIDSQIKNNSIKNLSTITQFIKNFIGENIEKYKNLITEVFNSFKKQYVYYKSHFLISDFNFENFDEFKKIKDDIIKDINKFECFEGHLVLYEKTEYDKTYGEYFFKYFEVSINKNEYEKLCEDLKISKNDSYLTYLRQYDSREKEIKDLNYDYKKNETYKSTFILLNSYFNEVIKGNINGNYIVKDKTITEIMTNLPNDLYTINDKSIYKLKQILDFTKKISKVEKKVNRKRSIHYKIIDKEETLSSIEDLIDLNEKYNENKTKVDKIINDFTTKLNTLKSIIKNSNDTLKTLKDEYKKGIDTSKYNDSFFEGILYKDINSIETEVNSLKEKVDTAVKKYNEDTTKKLEEEKAKADEKNKKKIKEAEDKGKEIKSEIEKVCNDYLTSINNLTITENFDKNTISTGLDQKITELYSTKKYNSDNLTGWKNINDTLLLKIQQLKSECVNKCNEEIDKKLKDISDKKQKELEEQQKKNKEEQDEKELEKQNKNTTVSGNTPINKNISEKNRDDKKCCKSTKKNKKMINF